MRIIAATRVRNEEDIIEAMVRHHAPLVDAHLVLDNASTDRTPEILRALRDEGLSVHVLEDGTAHFAEAEHNTTLYRLACGAFGADWVVFLDADEFIDPRGFANLSAVLAAVPDDVASVGMQLRNYEAGRNAAAGELNVLRRLTRRTVAPTDVWKVMVRGRADPDAVVVDSGNHQITLHGVVVAPLRQDAVVLAHYPSRSPLHWAGKAAVGRLRVLGAGERELGQGVASHYVPFFADVKADPRGWLARAEAAVLARADDPSLTEDPLPYRGAPLRYTRPVDFGARALASVLDVAEQIAAAHGRLLDAARPPPLRTQRYRRATLDEIAASGAALPDGRARVERHAWRDAETLEVPPFAFGSTDAPRSEVAEALRAEAPGGRFHRPPIASWVLRDALVHGKYGMVTIDDRAVDETLHHLPLHLLHGAGFADEAHLRLPDRPVAATLPVAYHLLACNQGNYFHWLIDALARFSAGHFASLGSAPQAPGGAVLLVPHLDVFWKWETLNALLAGDLPRLALAAEGMTFVQRLHYIPDLSGGGFLPHTALLDVFDAIASAFGHAPPGAARPWRRLYVARTDSQNRVLVNEAEVMARAERAGFTPVVLSGMSVLEQVRLFAEASHIVAPHGAGLTNLGFCRPGTAVCELHMDRYLNWAFRRLAARRGLRYGCLVGETVAEGAWVHSNTWRIDPNVVEAVLRDPRFLGT